SKIPINPEAPPDRYVYVLLWATIVIPSDASGTFPDFAPISPAPGPAGERKGLQTRPFREVGWAPVVPPVPATETLLIDLSSGFAAARPAASQPADGTPMISMEVRFITAPAKEDARILSGAGALRPISD